MKTKLKQYLRAHLGNMLVFSLSSPEGGEGRGEEADGFTNSNPLTMNPVAADVSPLHLNTKKSQSRLTSAATVQGFNARIFRGILTPTRSPFGRGERARTVSRYASYLLAALLGIMFTFNLHAQSTNLLLHWALEEGSGTNTTEAVSGETNVAHLMGDATWTNGIAPGSSHAVHFSNAGTGWIDAGTLTVSNTYVAGMDPGYQSLDNQWTIAAWVNLDVPQTTPYRRELIGSATNVANWWDFGVQDWEGTPAALQFDFNSIPIYSQIGVPLGKPVFIAVLADSAGLGSVTNRHRFAMWDGAKWSFEDGTEFCRLGLAVNLGTWQGGLGKFDGAVDDVRIYNTALSMADLTSLALNNQLGGNLGVIVTATAALTNSTSLDFTVQFTEDVQGFDPSDLAISNSPSLLTGTPVITGSNSTYTVSIPVQGTGLISLDVLPGTGVQTLGGAPLVNHFASQTVEVDQTPPTVTSISLIGANPTPALSVGFNVMFSEPVIGFNDSNDVLVAHSGTTNTGVNITDNTGGGTNYMVTLTGVTGDGSFTVAVDPAGNTKDLAGNSLISSITSAPVTHYIDTTPPYVVSITPDSTGPITNGTVGFTVVFSEPVIGFDGNLDLEFDTNNIVISDMSGFSSDDGSNYTGQIITAVTDGATSGTFDARVTLSTNITDLAGNPLVNPDPTSAVVTVSASPYQLWAISEGLTAGVNFSPDQDPDNDGLVNATEFARDDNPLAPNDPVKQRMTIADVGGQKFGVFTIAAPDSFVYGTNDVPGELGASYEYFGLGVNDSIFSSTDLLNWTNGSVPFIEDPSIATPPGLPALSPGWSYRHFRLTDPVDTRAKVFMKDGTSFF